MVNSSTPILVKCSAPFDSKVVSNRYDPFRLEVSPSYRELFDRDLKSALAREEWRIVPLKRRARRRRHSTEPLELKLKLN